ncbi:MAG: acyltransferase family protein [Acholeplasmatales bacterium]|nr:acyltransferase family protein [Acholeplasmatales bacterium]
MESILPFKEVNKRNYTFDLLKALFAIGVIFVHFPFPGILGKILSSIGICGVIFFFLISGYSAYNKDDIKACQNIKKRFKRNLKITLIIVLIYLIFAILENIITNTFDDFLAYFKNPWLIPRMIVLGDFSFIYGDPLWFLVALLYSYLVLLLLHKFKIMKYAFYFIPVLLLLRIGMETYVNSYNVDWHFSGNFLVGGLPIMLLGEYIKYKKDSFLKSPLLENVILFITSFTFMFLSVNIHVGDLDISQVFKIWSMVELFLIALRIEGKKEVPIIGTLGRKYSLYIYLFHCLIGITISDLLYLFHQDWVIEYILPILAAIFGVLISIVFYEINSKIKQVLAKKI